MPFQKHCPGCFHEKSGVSVCPICGYDEALPRSPLFLPHGSVIGGQYRVGRVLGQPGGFGVTYLGWDIHLQQRVAIKEFLPRDIATRHPGALQVSAHTEQSRANFEFGKEQFLREARIVAKLDHPNVVRVRGFFNANGTAYLVMDYYEGLSLGEYLTRVRKVIEPALAVPLIRPVLEALQYVHEHGVVHRDLKPHNIYLATIGKPIVLDFGAARHAAGERVHSMSVVLTDGYAPLEQYQRRSSQGPWTDVYGAGATLFRMLTGTPPPNALDRLNDDPLQRDGWVSIPRALRPALTRALAVAPEARFQTIADFILALSDYRPHIGTPARLATGETFNAQPTPEVPPPAQTPEAPIAIPEAQPVLEPEPAAPIEAPEPVAEPFWSDGLPPEVPAPAYLPEPEFDPEGRVIGEDAAEIPDPDTRAQAAQEYDEAQEWIESSPVDEAEEPMLESAALASDDEVQPARRAYPMHPPSLPEAQASLEVAEEQEALEPASRGVTWTVIAIPVALTILVLAFVGVLVYQMTQPKHTPVVFPVAPPVVETPAPTPPVAPVRPSAGGPPAHLPRMVNLPEGSTRIGDDRGTAAEKPAHTVHVHAFAISADEITIQQFGEFVSRTGYANPKWANYGCQGTGASDPTWDKPGGPDNPQRPVVCVSAEDATAYANWLSQATGHRYRLPTEDEWEYAARGGSSARYWWGDSFDSAKASCDGCGQPRQGPQSVGSWPRNGFGLADTAGNVREWTCSSYSIYGLGEDARCATDNQVLAVRGGSWIDNADGLQSTHRVSLDADRRDVWTGFRLAQDPGAVR